mgnify:FL=1
MFLCVPSLIAATVGKRIVITKTQTICKKIVRTDLIAPFIQQELNHKTIIGNTRWEYLILPLFELIFDSIVDKDPFG